MPKKIQITFNNPLDEATNGSAGTQRWTRHTELPITSVVGAKILVGNGINSTQLGGSGNLYAKGRGDVIVYP